MCLTAVNRQSVCVGMFLLPRQPCSLSVHVSQHNICLWELDFLCSSTHVHWNTMYHLQIPLSQVGQMGLSHVILYGPSYSLNLHMYPSHPTVLPGTSGMVPWNSTVPLRTGGIALRNPYYSLNLVSVPPHCFTWDKWGGPMEPHCPT